MKLTVQKLNITHYLQNNINYVFEHSQSVVHWFV